MKLDTITLIIFLVSSIHFNLHAQTQEEISALTDKAKTIHESCITNPFHELLTIQNSSMSLKTYLDLKDRCVSSNLSQVLTGLNNQIRLEKQVIQSIKKIKSKDKIEVITNRIDFISKSLKQPMSLAETLMHLMWLREYSLLAKDSKNTKILEHAKQAAREIRQNQEKLFSETISHDSMIIINEFVIQLKSDKASKEEQRKAKDALELHWKLTNAINNNTTCLTHQKCYICFDLVQSKKCDIQKIKKKFKSESETYYSALLKYTDSAIFIENKLTKLEKTLGL